MKNSNDNTIQEEVLNAIKEGKLNMRPKWHFILKAILRALSIIILFFALVYLLNFIGLVTHEKDFNLLDLSPRGMRAFMTAVPWVIVLLSMSLLSIFYILIKKYSFVYKKPIVYGFFGLIFFVLFIGFVIHIFDMNYRFARFGEGARTPILGPMHKYYRGEMNERKDFDRIEKRMQKIEKFKKVY
jgi:glucan phosphoethanolaminetransferase (alkaline phosphatase superfamily)